MPLADLPHPAGVSWGYLAELASIALAQWRSQKSSNEPNRSHIPSFLGQAPRGSRVGALPSRGLSSAGRATESHSVGHRFDPDRLHQQVGEAYRLFVGAPSGRGRLHQQLRRRSRRSCGALAQLGERVLCKHEVTGSIPVGSTSFDGLLAHIGIGSVAQVVRAHA